MTYRLLPMAEADVEAIADHIAESNPSAARRLVDRFIARWELLATQPASGSVLLHVGMDVRHVVVGKYVTLYRVDQGAVEIIRVLHGHRDVGADDIQA